ncbi:MAG: cell wall hydrolase [Oscillospiraceae bacterium]|nr:cell wall hydrolase [Oscillospiraceae bacterium]
MKKICLILTVLAMWGCLSTFAKAEEPPEPDWLALMTEAAVAGDREAGIEAAAGWNADESRTSLDWDQLFLLAKLINWEAGSDWLPDELRLSVGEVVLNRVASPEFPDTLEAVVYQDSQFSGVDCPAFRDYYIPSRPCVEAALRLLLGERMLRPTVVFTGHQPQGKIHSMFMDLHFGRIYFCESHYPELYGTEPEADETAPPADPQAADGRNEKDAP